MINCIFCGKEHVSKAIGKEVSSKWDMCKICVSQHNFVIDMKAIYYLCSRECYSKHVQIEHNSVDIT